MATTKTVEQGLLLKVVKEKSSEIVKPKDGKKFSLEELQKFVGGYIEVILMKPGTKGTMYGNEEAMLLNLPLNNSAHSLKHPQTLGVVCGDVIIVTRVPA